MLSIGRKATTAPRILTERAKKWYNSYHWCDMLDKKVFAWTGKGSRPHLVLILLTFQANIIILVTGQALLLFWGPTQKL